MIRWVSFLVFSAALVGAAPALGHSASPPHECRAPTRPQDEQNDLLWQAFLEEVDGFRQCISDFVEANRSAAQLHTAAAKSAAAAWNRFVRDDLNAPQDFPWPVEEPPEEK